MTAPAGSAEFWSRLRTAFMNAVVQFGLLEARVLPREWLLGMGKAAARAGFELLPGLRANLLANARRLLGPQADRYALRAQCLGVMHHFSRFFVDLITGRGSLPPSLEGASAESLRDRLMIGFDNAEAARAHGQGVIAVTLHMGSYELGPLILPGLIEPVAIVYNRDPWGVFEALRSQARTSARVREIPIEGPLFTVEARQILQQRGVVLAAADAGFDHQRGRLYPFLGGQAPILDRPARLAFATGAAILPCFTVADRRGHYRIEIAPPLFPSELEDTDAAMRLLIETFERYVKRYPEQWLILHRYWTEDPSPAAVEPGGLSSSGEVGGNRAHREREHQPVRSL